MFNQLDHIAIVVRDTDEALTFYRDQLRLPVILTEEIAEAKVRLTHLDLGNVQLQLVQPLSEDHPLAEHLRQHGEGLHHLCLLVDGIPEAVNGLPKFGLAPKNQEPHRGPRGRQAIFVDPSTTRGVLWEMTADPAE